jgi:hypothetical protein
MDFPPIFWIFWAIALLVIGAGVRRTWLRRKAWTDAADELGLVYLGALDVKNLKLEGDLDGVNVFVHVERADRNFNGPRVFTVIETTHAQSAMLEEHIEGVADDKQQLVDAIRQQSDVTRRESKRS